MPHETLPTIEELNRMDDISGSALYSAEVRRIPWPTTDEQKTYAEAASTGDEHARNALLTNCLNWVLSKAAYTYIDKEPVHTDLMDLVGHASVKMLEAMPKALHCVNPMSYLLSVAAMEMKLYCIYDDPMVKRSRTKTPTSEHPRTVSLEAYSYPLLARTPGPDCSLEEPEAKERLDSPEYQIVYEALQTMSERRRTVLTCVYGLFGNPAMRVADVARMLNVPVKTVENDLCRGKKRLAEKLGPYLTELGLHAV